MKTAYFYHPDCAKHEMGSAHAESPLRIGAIHSALQQSALLTRLQQHEAKEALREQLTRVHDSDYVEDIFLRSPSTGVEVLDPDTSLNPHSLRAALLAAGAVVQATELVCEGKARNAFCNVRPPGHHAESFRAMGFCIFNSIAVGIAHALEKYKLARVALVDFDVHHGNGSEDIFRQESRVLLCQTFQSPLYPGTGSASEKGHIINTPLRANSDGEKFREAITTHWLPALEAFQPQMIFVSAGFDAHKADPLAQLALDESDYQWLSQALVNIADKYSQGRIVSSLEGGYNLEALAKSAHTHIETLASTAEKHSEAMPVHFEV